MKCAAGRFEPFLRDLVLTDETMDENRAPIPMILATGAVHSHLMRQNLRTFASINLRSGECLDVHYFAVLIGVGATAVNAYLAQESIAERHRRGLFADMTLEQCIHRFGIRRGYERLESAPLGTVAPLHQALS